MNARDFRLRVARTYRDQAAELHALALAAIVEYTAAKTASRMKYWLETTNSLADAAEAAADAAKASLAKRMEFVAP